MHLIGRVEKKSASGGAISLWLKRNSPEWKGRRGLRVSWMMSLGLCFVTAPWGEGKVLKRSSSRVLMFVSYWSFAPTVTRKQQSQCTWKEHMPWNNVLPDQWLMTRGYVPRLCGCRIPYIVWCCSGEGSSKVTLAEIPTCATGQRLQVKIHFKN